MDPLEVTREDNASRPMDESIETSMSKKSNVRKRTKTGCLTCRKRRIKCDEGKPTCNNCQKSKRQCEGYNQRLTFKEPLGAPFHHGRLLGPPVYHHHHHHPQAQEAFLAAQIDAQQQRVGIPQGPLPIIAPRPHLADYQGGVPLPYGPYYPDPARHSVGIPLVSRSGLYSPELQVPVVPYLSPVDHSSPPLVHHTSFNQSAFVNAAASPLAHFHHGNRTVEPMPHSSDHRNPSVALSESTLDHRHRSVSLSESTLVSPVDEEIPLNRVRSGESGYWDSDDEASMGDSDDEAYADRQAAHLASNDLGILVAQRLDHPADRYSTHTRDFTASLDVEWLLQTYTPSSVNTPLNDKDTASVFWYFVNVTGPSMSLYERHPFDPAPVFQGQPIPKSQQHIWTYTFPVISLNHPALLQAMLALGSLQMAKTRCLPATAAMKHYHLSLRRIAKNYQSNFRRTQPATLAATLLLGFYEVWNSDHDKWCKHMWGARAILREIPLKEMTWEVQALKRSRRQRLRQEMQSRPPGRSNIRICDPADLVQEEDMDDVDPEFIAQITGRPVRFLEHRGPMGRATQGRYTEQDIENYEHLSDLFWWYCKMDVYQSILGGTQLFMEYDLWTQCAPRSPIGKLDAIYGTFDHTVLLLGRLANYASRDLDRKRRVMKREAAAKGMTPSQGNSPPSFPGLLPSKGLFSRPAGFSPPRDTTPPSESGHERDFESERSEALEEWKRLRHAFGVFAAKLGPDFQPLSPDTYPPEETPFGPSIAYRTFSQAGIWMNYYMGLIALERAHPDMPPIATVAAGMAAANTADWANQIGRIAAGLSENLSNVTNMPTIIGSALIESSFCLFVAAVQFQDTAQRHWVIKRMHDIARLTGWQSARQIADGCESAWIKAASVGRGPHYERANGSDSAQHTSSIWASPRRIDRRIRELEYGGEDSRIVLAKTERAHYALGLLGVEQDLEKLELREGP